MFLKGMYLGTMKGWIGHYFGHYFGLYSGFTKVLPGRICLTSALIQPSARNSAEIVPDPPLHSAQIILAFRKKDFYCVWPP